MIQSRQRRSIRLKGYDYSQAGAYYVTICTMNRKIIFGDITDAGMSLNPFGTAVKNCWEDLSDHYSHVQLDAFVVMPNHVHGIIVLLEYPNVGAGFKPAPTKRHALPEIVRAFKTFSGRNINEIRGTPGQPVWQRTYYEHVIRNEIDLEEIRKYIQDNPFKWLEDENHPANPCKT